jgi:hypothetical protein
MPTPQHPRDIRTSGTNSRELQPAPRPGLIEYDHPAAPQIGEWLRQNVLTRDDDYGFCTKVVVTHFSINKKPQGDVTTIKLPENFGTDPGHVDALVSDVIRAAQDDANNLHSGIQLYAVFAHYAKNQNYRPRRYFRVGAEEEYDPESGGADPSETPDGRGLVAQAMRHLEAVFKTSVMNTSYLIQTLQQENQGLRQMNQQQNEQAVEMGALIQETLDNSTARRLSEKEAENKQNMMGAVFEHLKLLIPVIMNKIAGQKIAPETDPSFQLLAALFEGMSSEQQQALVTNFLTPAQGAVFAEFLDTYEKRKRALTSSDSKGPALDLKSLFDSVKEQSTALVETKDPKLASLEKHATSFREAFSRRPTFTGPIKPGR